MFPSTLTNSHFNVAFSFLLRNLCNRSIRNKAIEAFETRLSKHSSVLLLQLIKPPITKAKRFEKQLLYNVVKRFFVNVPFAFKQVCKKAREIS